MGRPKGGTNKYWSKEDKLKIVNKVLIDGISARQVGMSENISDGMICRWIKKYLEQGEAALENQKKPGNPLSKYSKKKNLTDLERLEYENMRLRIENERLKKGHMMKGDGTVVIFKE